MTQKQRKCAEWLSWHEDLIRDLPAAEFEIRNEHRDRWRYIVELLKKADVIGRTVHWTDVNIPLCVFIAKLRIAKRKEHGK